MEEAPGSPDRRRQLDPLTRWLLVAALVGLPAVLGAVTGYQAGQDAGLGVGAIALAVVLLVLKVVWRAKVGLLFLLLVPVFMWPGTGSRLAVRQHGTPVNATVTEVDSHRVWYKRGYRTEADYHVLVPGLQPLVVHTLRPPRYAVGEVVSVLVDSRGRADPVLVEELHLPREFVFDVLFGVPVLVLAFVWVNVDPPWENGPRWRRRTAVSAAAGADRPRPARPRRRYGRGPG